MGNTPEMLYKIEKGGAVETVAIAGTRPLGAGMATELLSSLKDNFENKIVSRDQIRKVPYHIDVDFSNVEDTPLTFAVDTSRLRDAFKIEPSAGSLAPGERMSVRVSFLPTEPREFSSVVPLYLDGNTERAYLDLTLKGVGMYAQLTFAGGADNGADGEPDNVSYNSANARANEGGARRRGARR